MNFSQSIANWYKSVIRNPKYRWWIIGGSLLYLVSPLDISPDFLPIVGWIDDGMIATLLIAEVSQILMERLKGKNEPVAENAASAANGAAKPAETVEVNAVAVDA